MNCRAFRTDETFIPLFLVQVFRRHLYSLSVAIGTSALIQSSPASSSGAKELQQRLELLESSCSFKHLMSYDHFLMCSCVLLTVVLTRVLSFVHLFYAGCLLPSSSEGFVYQHWDVHVESQSCELLRVDGPLYSGEISKEQALNHNIIAAISVC